MRDCGGCTLCCTLLSVQDINKQAREECRYVCEDGCSIYDRRPHSCNRFNCLWLKGDVPERAKPDKVGVVFDEAKPRITGKRMPLLVIERRDGDSRHPELLPVILELGRGRSVFIVGSNNIPIPFDENPSSK